MRVLLTTTESSTLALPLHPLCHFSVRPHLVRPLQRAVRERPGSTLGPLSVTPPSPQLPPACWAVWSVGLSQRAGTTTGDYNVEDGKTLNCPLIINFSQICFLKPRMVLPRVTINPWLDLGLPWPVCSELGLQGNMFRRNTHFYTLRIKCQERKPHQGNSLRDTPSCQPCSPVFGIAFDFLQYTSLICSEPS